ncbi:hypothetical protein BBJ28_00002435 [Nothophytophthora sp. Chile5]|nr:hypothetical protein BBJ28_00002435 [Nothophytophthora sp. Chile5]
MVQPYTYSRSPDQPYATEMLPLPKDELDALRLEAHAAYDQLFPAVQAAVRIGSDGDSFNVAHRGSNAKSVAMWTTSMLFGTLEEVAALYLGQGSQQIPIVVDSARSRRLYELEAPSNDRPLHGSALRWSLWKPPSKLSDGRDLCVLEYMDSFVDSDSGRRVWARATKSVNHMCCPASQHPEGPVRTFMRVSGMILRETERPGVLEHVTFVHVDAKGVPSWVVQQAISVTKKAASGLNQVLKVVRQLTPQPLGSASIDSTQSDSDKDRSCRACRDRISKWTVAKRCRFCDAVLCKRCVEICYQRADASGKNHRMCVSCALYTGSVTSQSGSGGLSYSRSNSRARNATVITERKLSAATLSALSKQTSLPTLSMQSSVCSDSQRPSISMETDSVGSGSQDAAPVRERLEHLQLHSPTGSFHSSRSASSTRSGGNEWMQRPRSRRDSLAIALELEPARPEPIDLSYLTTLVTPRAGAVRGVDI